MNKSYYYLLFALLLAPATLNAQDADSLAENDYKAERHVIESALGTMVRVIKTATFREQGGSVQTELHDLAARLNAVNQSLPALPLAAAAQNAGAQNTVEPTSISDLQALENTLSELSDQIRDIRRTLEAENEIELAEQLAPVEHGIDNAVVQTRRLIFSEQTEPTVADAEIEPDENVAPWLEPGAYREGRRVSRGEVGDDVDDTMDDVREGIAEAHVSYDEAMEDVRAGITEARTAVEEATQGPNSRVYHRYRQKHDGPFDDFNYAEAYVGEFFNRWPYRETALYRPIPAIRYNRVEGLVLGARFMPLEWGDWETAKIYGQVGYAFELKDIRYEVGAEVRPFPYMDDDFDFKLGASYRSNTATNDIWKVNWVENTIAAMLFEYDFLDYYDVEGFSIYAMQRLSPYAQFSIGYRSEDYASMVKDASWSLFGRRDFRLNPFVSSGHMNSMVMALEGGRLSGLYSIPRGAAFRFEGELGEGFGGDFNFSRVVGDMRFYVPFGYGSSFGLRLRGGYASENAPIQKMFTLGGVGSIRAYPQNAYFGTRMLLANVEYTIANISPLDDIFHDIQVFGFGDAGWVNSFSSSEFAWDDVLPAAGFGVSFADRSLRLELAWPLKEVGGKKDPTLWLRITPTF